MNKESLIEAIRILSQAYMDETGDRLDIRMYSDSEGLHIEDYM